MGWDVWAGNGEKGTASYRRVSSKQYNSHRRLSTLNKNWKNVQAAEIKRHENSFLATTP
jgi:hypothetical protein